MKVNRRIRRATSIKSSKKQIEELVKIGVYGKQILTRVGLIDHQSERLRNVGGVNVKFLTHMALTQNELGAKFYMRKLRELCAKPHLQHLDPVGIGKKLFGENWNRIYKP